MAADRRVKEHDGEDVAVSFDPGLCIHAQECVKGLPTVFDVERRPWIQPANADADEIVAVVARCPTGALHTRRRDGGAEERPPDGISVREVPDGPLYVRGEVRLVDEDGGVIREDWRMALCRCGASSDKPFCDGSHTQAGFRA